MANILIVDDHTMLAKMLACHLKRADHRVEIAASLSLGIVIILFK